MDSRENNEGYKYLVEKFGAEKIKSRYEWIFDLLDTYLTRKQLQNRVCIVPDILNHVVVDYFVDIDRLKNFQGMSMVNQTKIMAYTAFWLLRHKVLQITDTENAADLVYVNEDAVGEMLRTYLFDNPSGAVILPEKAERIDAFVDTMKYFFQYRLYTAQNIELMLMAFDAGRDYQYCADFQE